MVLKAELETEELNMTPMIDVVFNLLIFFLLGSTYMSEERELEIQLPGVPQAQPLTQAPDEITVNVLPDGRITIRDEEHSLPALLQRLTAARENYPDQVVAIRGDADVRYERVAQVIATCQQAGIRKVDFPVLQEE